MPSRVFRVSLPLALVACLSAIDPPPTSARDDVPDDIVERQNPVELPESELRYYTRQYRAKCARCHGLDGAGGGEEAKAQAVPPRDFTDAGYMRTRTDGQLFHQILAGGGDRCAMPAFGPGSDHAWSEEKIWSMVAFIRRFAQPGGDAKD